MECFQAYERGITQKTFYKRDYRDVQKAHTTAKDWSWKYLMLRNYSVAENIK